MTEPGQHRRQGGAHRLLGAGGAFKSGEGDPAPGRIQAELYEQIGRLNMEVEWLKQKAARYG